MFGGDEGGLGLRGERDEALQQTPGQFEPDPERASRGEILVEKLLQVGHSAPPGPGWRESAQRIQIDLRVDLGGLRMTVAQDLPDVFERGPVVEACG